MNNTNSEVTTLQRYRNVHYYYY